MTVELDIISLHNFTIYVCTCNLTVLTISGGSIRPVWYMYYTCGKDSDLGCWRQCPATEVRVATVTAQAFKHTKFCSVHCKFTLTIVVP